MNDLFVILAMVISAQRETNVKLNSAQPDAVISYRFPSCDGNLAGRNVRLRPKPVSIKP